MITTSICDDGRCSECPGVGLVNGDEYIHGKYQGKHWVRVPCEHSCHSENTFLFSSSSGVPTQHETRESND